MNTIQSRPLTWLCVACIFAASAPARETARGSWDSAITKLSGPKIRVNRYEDPSISGTFVSATPDGITVRSKHEEVTVERSKVRKIQRTGGGRRFRNAAIGAGAGGGVAAAVVSQSGGSDDFASLLTGAIVIGAAIGCVIGLVLPASSTVYDATC